VIENNVTLLNEQLAVWSLNSKRVVSVSPRSFYRNYKSIWGGGGTSFFYGAFINTLK
jgi:hypothetical protein